MKNKKVSIVIPTFNRVNYLKQCIDSCLNQTVPCEVIVVDHGSTDSTPELAKSFGDAITYVRRELDSGVHFCWMDGLLHATNDLIHFNFDDDWIEPTFIEECIEQFKDESVGMVLTDAKIYFENQNTFRESSFGLNTNTGVYKAKDLLKFNLNSLTSPCAGVYRKKILIDSLFIGQIPFTKFEYKGVGPDILFTMLTCSEYKHYGYVAKSLVVFRAHDGSITIDSQRDSVKSKNIARAYNEARIFYFIHRIVKGLNLYFIAKLLLKIKKRI